jgi:CelD/BcsL family acetyltransferase involved in cellulose biosynthesis
MQLSLIQSTAELENLASEWNDLLTCCSASHVPFLRHEYLLVWWSTLGGGEWKTGELYTVTARLDDGSLAGIAPLFITENQQGEPALMLLGSIEISDYLDFIVRTDLLEEFFDALLDFLAADPSPRWKVIDLYNMLAETPSIEALRKAALHKGWDFRLESLQPCPYIPLPGDWEAYLAGIDKKQRHEIRRKMRRLEEHPVPVSWYIVDDASRLDSEITEFFKIMANDPAKDLFLTGEMQHQLRLCMHAAFEAGWLQLVFMEVGGRKAAGYLNFDYAGHIWVYNSGFSYEFSELSPGWVLLGYLLKWSNDHQRLSFDFMRGGEDYKYRFGAVDRQIMRLCLSPR